MLKEIVPSFNLSLFFVWERMIEQLCPNSPLPKYTIFDDFYIELTPFVSLNCPIPSPPVRPDMCQCCFKPLKGEQTSDTTCAAIPKTLATASRIRAQTDVLCLQDGMPEHKNGLNTVGPMVDTWRDISKSWKRNLPLLSNI